MVYWVVNNVKVSKEDVHRWVAVLGPGRGEAIEERHFRRGYSGINGEDNEGMVTFPWDTD